MARRTVRLASPHRACRYAKAAGNLCPHIMKKRGKKTHKNHSEESGTVAERREAPPPRPALLQEAIVSRDLRLDDTTGNASTRCRQRGRGTKSPALDLCVSSSSPAVFSSVDLHRPFKSTPRLLLTLSPTQSWSHGAYARESRRHT